VYNPTFLTPPLSTTKGKRQRINYFVSETQKHNNVSLTVDVRSAAMRSTADNTELEEGGTGARQNEIVFASPFNRPFHLELAYVTSNRAPETKHL